MCICLQIVLSPRNWQWVLFLCCCWRASVFMQCVKEIYASIGAWLRVSPLLLCILRSMGCGNTAMGALAHWCGRFVDALRCVPLIIYVFYFPSVVLKLLFVVLLCSSISTSCCFTLLGMFIAFDDDCLGSCVIIRLTGVVCWIDCHPSPCAFIQGRWGVALNYVHAGPWLDHVVLLFTCVTVVVSIFTFGFVVIFPTGNQYYLMFLFCILLDVIRWRWSCWGIFSRISLVTLFP